MPEATTRSATRVRPAIIELTSVRTKEFLRETEAIFWVFGFPLILALALGFAFRDKPPDRVPVGVLEGPSAQQRLAALRRSATLLPHIVSEAEGADALRHGKVSLLVAGSDAIVYRFDPTRPESRGAAREANDALQGARGRHDPVPSREEHTQEQGGRYIDYLIPGLIGMTLMGTGIWGMGFSVVNARMKKLLKRLIATPMRKRDYLLSQFISRLVFLIVEVTVLVAFGWLVFGVRVSGSLLTLAILCILGGFAFTGVGLLTASRAKTIEAVSGMANLIMMPMWICSGVFFSYERFPEAAKRVIRLLPLTALNDALRAVMNDASSFAHILPQMIILAVWGVTSFIIGLRIFRWQ